MRNRIVAALDRTILPGLSGSITADFYKTPDDFAHDYLSVHGAGFSVAPLFRQSAWFRFHNQAEGIKTSTSRGPEPTPEPDCQAFCAPRRSSMHLSRRLGGRP